MKNKGRAVLGGTARSVTLTLAVALLFGAGSARAATQYESDGVKQDPLTGKWVLPAKGACAQDNTITTRPECIATMFSAYPDSVTCATSVPSGVSNPWSNTSNVCVDNVHNTALTCVSGGGIDRKWSNGACLLTMKDFDRNKVTCANQGGRYGPVGTVIAAVNTAGGACFGVWVMPDASTYSPVLLNRTGVNPSTGDQCLRCHRNDTQWNVNDVRWVDSYTATGHRNMSRKSTPNVPQVGPDGTPYPTDSTGLAFDWIQGKVNGNQLYWIYNGWFEEPHLPSSVANVPASAGTPGVAYSCARCHTTGWTSDAAVGPSVGNLAKEPEKSFPGISWDGVSAATNGQVNLKSGVAGDPNGAKTASWDLFGITCNRCHGAVVDNASHGGVPAFTAPTGYSTHNNSMTGTSGNGYCSIPGPTATAQCTAIGGTWLTTLCSDGISATQSACVAAGKTWTYAACSANSLTSTAGTVPVNGLPVPQAYCSAPTPSTSYSTSAACIAVAGAVWTDVTTTFGTLSACTGAGFTWDGVASKCNTCYVPNGKSPAACAAQNVSPLSTTFTNAYASDVDSCVDAGGKWTDTKTQRGQIITGLCTQCHRQETSGLPNTNGSCSNPAKTTNGACVAAGGTWTDSGNGLPLTVGLYHNTVTFPSHFHGNQYLNSPHAKYTGKFANIATAPFGYGGPNIYQSFFIQDGESAGTGNGCTGCHNVHKSTDEAANPAGGAVKECTECHAKNLALINHPSGIGTPLEKPAEACASCHMPAGEHFFRINVDKNYTTIPVGGVIAGTATSANTATDGTFTNAVWVDLDSACGKCHGGGANNSKTTGTVATGSPIVTVASSAGFVANEKVRITGAGAYYYNSGAQHHDLDTYVKSVDSPTQITLAGTAPFGVTSAAVVQNAVSNNASWFDRATLQTYATGIHNDKPTALFSAAYGADGLTVVTDASASSCSGSNASCNAFAWDFGDSGTGSGVTSSHTYAAPGTYTITLTVTQYGFAPGTTTRKFTAYATDNAPTAAGACSFSGTTWVATCNNSSSDDKGLSLLSINWGDGTMLTNVTVFPAPGPFTHSYLVPGTYKITFKAVDTNGQQNRNSGVITPTGDPIVAASFQYFSIGGTVFKPGALPLGAAQIQVKKGGVLVKSAMSAADGTYSTGAMKPGTYTLTVSKTGFTFTVSTLTVTTPGNATGQNFTAN